MASLAAKAARIRDDLESSRIPIGSTILWMGPLAKIPATYLNMEGQTASALAAYPKLLEIFPNGLPDARDRFPRGAHSGRLPATVEEDAIRNIRGVFGNVLYESASAAQGATVTTNGVFTRAPTAATDAFVTSGYTTSVTTVAQGTNGVQDGFIFDASTVVPTASENRPKSIAACMLVKAYHSDQILAADASSGNLWDAMDQRYIKQEQNLLYGVNLFDNPKFSVCQRPAHRRIGTSGHLRPADRWSFRHSSLTGQALDATTAWPTTDITKPSYLYINTEALPKGAAGIYLRQDHYCGYRGNQNILAEIMGSNTKELVFSGKFGSGTGDPLTFTGISIVATNFTTKAEFANASVSAPVTMGAGNATTIKDVVINIEDFRNSILASGLLFNNIVISIFVSFAAMGNGTYRFEHFKLEVGNKSTPFGLVDFVNEVEKCKAYYNFVNMFFAAQNQGSGTGCYTAQEIPALIRTPTIVYGSDLATNNSAIGKVNINSASGTNALYPIQSGGAGYSAVGGTGYAIFDGTFSTAISNPGWTRVMAEYEAEPLVV